jgi:soluble lytic murein transglycosylase-like protein
MRYQNARTTIAVCLLVTLPAVAPALAHERTSGVHHRLRLHAVAATQQNAVSPFAPFASLFSFAAPAPQTMQEAQRGPRVVRASAPAESSAYAGMVSAQASANGVPESLVHRVIMRESRYNAHAVSRGNYGIMQIRLGTARAMGYSGSAAGLLDPETNMTYAVRYLAGAYRAAGGNESRAVALYSSGYYQQAKAQGSTPYASPAANPAPQMWTASDVTPDANSAAPAGHRFRHYRHHPV